MDNPHETLDPTIELWSEEEPSRIFAKRNILAPRQFVFFVVGKHVEIGGVQSYEKDRRKPW